MSENMFYFCFMYATMIIVTHMYLNYVDTKMEELEKMTNEEHLFFTIAWPITVLCFLFAMFSDGDVTDGY